MWGTIAIVGVHGVIGKIAINIIDCIDSSDFLNVPSVKNSIFHIVK